MTQISFYTLSTSETEGRLQFVCRLTEKALSLGHRVFIHTESMVQARQLNDLLWQFKPASFIPHGLAGDNDSNSDPVTIGMELPEPEQDDVLINLSGNACESHRRFSRINEIICADEESLGLGRDHYRFYQTQGYQPETHKL